MSRFGNWIALIAVPVIATIVLGVTASDFAVRPARAQDSELKRPSDDIIASADRLSAAFEYVAETVAPSVVTVRSRKRVEMRSGLQRVPDQFFNSPFDRFFDDDFFRRFEQPAQPNQPRFQVGEGSGFIVRADGYILTNSHVVEDAEEVTVFLSDERQFSAEVIGRDPKTDVAVIKIDSDGLQPARLGNSDTLRVGQWVVAAGNPFGLSSSITAGIISAEGRSRVGITDYEDFIQTDAAINQGNSGGPLLNLHGEVIGINTAIVSGFGGNVGIGFAIPINLAQAIMSDLIEDGRVVRGYLGVMIQDLSLGMAESFGYDSAKGALISEVTPGGPAAEAGLQPGDILSQFDGEVIDDVAQLRIAVATVDPGTEVEISVFRAGANETLKITVQEMPEDLAGIPNPEAPETDLGLTVETLNPNLAQQLGVDRNLTGVAIIAIEQFGPAANSGLRRGDVVTHVQDTPIKSTKGFHRALNDSDLNVGVRLTIRRDGQQLFAFFQIR